MMTTRTIPGSDFFKSLGKLEALANGGQSAKQPEDLSKAQLFHTPSDSNPKSWPGGESTEYGEKWDDSIGNDGTDYHPARKSIAEKALKGLPLSPEEIAILKSDIEMSVSKGEECDEDEKEESKKAFGGSKMTFKAQKDDDEDRPAPEEKDKSVTSMQEKMRNSHPVTKSFDAAMGQSETLQKGIELSGFLADFAKAFGSGLEGLEARTAQTVEQATNAILSQVGSYLDARFAEQATFNKSLAEAIVNIGHGVAGNLEQINQVAQAPAGPPKSQLRGGVQAIEKSFAGPKGDTISKSQKLDVMVDLVEKGQLNSLEVCKFETTGQLRPEVDALVMQHIQAGSK
jgi:hypothetical protein